MICSNCGSNVPDGAAFCPVCNAQLSAAPDYQQAAPQPTVQQTYDMQYNQPAYSDVTTIDRFASVKNHHDYLFGILAYLSIIGLIIVAVSEPNVEKSEYLKFHFNQALVILLFSLLSGIPFLGWIWAIFIIVCEIMAIVYAAKGQAKSATFFGNIKIIK